MGLFSGVGKLFGGSKTDLKYDTRPWSKQQRSALTYLYNEARKLAKQGGYPGDFYATLDPRQRAAIDAIASYTQGGLGSKLASGAGGVAQEYMEAAPGVISNLGGIYNRLMSSSAPGVLADASLYADNPYMQDMIQAATRDDVRAVTEGILPAIEAGAVGTGNTNSSRTAMRSAIAERGLQDRVADVAAGLRGGAYQSGLGLAMGDQQARTAGQLAVTGQLGGAVGTGLAAAAGSQGMTLDQLNALMMAGGVSQLDEQAKLEELYKKWQQPWEALARLGGLAMPNTGSTGTQPAAGPGVFQQLAGAFGVGAGGIGAILRGLK